MRNDVAAADLYLEDFTVGSLREFGDASLTQAEIVEYATRYDPQYFHVDPEKARDGPFGGLVASGWQTCGVLMRLMVDEFIPAEASLGSPGVDAIRWPNPVRPGDRLRVRVMVLEARRSKSKPDRGIVESHVEMLNQNGQTVLTMKTVMLVLARPA
jgi:acyl dehydratase